MELKWLKYSQCLKYVNCNLEEMQRELRDSRSNYILIQNTFQICLLIQISAVSLDKNLIGTMRLSGSRKAAGLHPLKWKCSSPIRDSASGCSLSVQRMRSERERDYRLFTAVCSFGSLGHSDCKHNLAQIDCLGWTHELLVLCEIVATYSASLVIDQIEAQLKLALVSRPNMTSMVGLCSAMLSYFTNLVNKIITS